MKAKKEYGSIRKALKALIREYVQNNEQKREIKETKTNWKKISSDRKENCVKVRGYFIKPKLEPRRSKNYGHGMEKKEGKC